MLCCDKQPSFELGCILFELAMCGKHPLPGYPGSYGSSGKVTFSFESEELFPMRPPQFPKVFCDLVRSLLQCDPGKRMPLLDAFEVLLKIESPSPLELLSFYSFASPSNDAGTLTSKATCQILCGSSTDDCVDTLHKALSVDPLFSPALLLLHYLSPCHQQMNESCDFYAIQASLMGITASFTSTDVEFNRAIINKKHRNTLPDLVLRAHCMHVLNDLNVSSEQTGHKKKAVIAEWTFLASVPSVVKILQASLYHEHIPINSPAGQIHCGAEKDNHKAVAMCNLGVCYENGDGVEKDNHKAVSLYQRAADAGHAVV
ncbi:hypothetical protein Pelo_5397 [Pelomyxa schiedti]|nr:hypothetical protein Pelo_5397 [Pelomyxa schiedti]